MSEKISINFLRHGETEYVEDKKRDAQEDMSSPELDLTELGIQQVKETAQKLAEQIDSKNEDVFLISSPNWRAQGSEKIIEEELIKNGINIIKKKISPTLRATPGKHNYEEDSKKVENNAMRFIKWAAIMTKKYNGERKIRVISVSHYEFLTPIMQRLFNFDIHNGEGYKKAELLNIELTYDQISQKVIISAEMRGKERRNIYFDSESKDFKEIDG